MMRLLIAAPLAAALALAGPAQCGSPTNEDKAMAPSDPPPGTPATSLAPPPDVAPVEIEGIRIAPAYEGLPLDAEDTNGWFRATDIATGEVLWLKQAFTAPPAEPGDPLAAAGDRVLFTRSLTVEGGAAVAEDDIGRRFRIDPKTGASQPLD